MRSAPWRAWLLFLAVLCALGTAWLSFHRVRQPANEVEFPEDSATGFGSEFAPLHTDASAQGKGSDAIAMDRVEGPSLRRNEAESPSESIEVLVTDLEGRGIPGAHVRTLQDSASGEFVADSDGRCRIQVPPEPTGRLSLMFPGPTIHLGIDAAGFFHATANVEWKPEVRVQLARAASIRGRVLDADSQTPVAGASVAFEHRCPDCRRQVTGPAGSFAVEVPAGRPVRVLVKQVGGPAASFTFHVDPASDREDHDLLLRIGTEIRGEVIDFTTRAPVPEVAILDLTQGAELTRTGPDGTFRARILPSASTNRFEVGIQAPGYCWLEREWTSRELAQAIPLGIELPKTSRIEGFVRDPEGKGVADLTVLIASDLAAQLEGRCDGEEIPPRLRDALNGWDLGASPRSLEYVRTDDSGRFRASDLIPWMPCYRIAPFPDQAAFFEIQGGPLGGPGEVTHVDATASVVLVGRVTGRLLLNGKPIAGELHWKGATRDGFGATNSHGRFSLGAVEAGGVTVETVRSTGEANASRGLRSSYEITLKPGETLERDFELVLAMAAISGRVTTALGEPAARTRVTLHVPALPGQYSTFQASTVTDAAGRWSIDVPADSSPCTIRAGEFPDQLEREGVRPGASDVEFVQKAAPSGRLRVRVVDSAIGTLIAYPELAWCKPGTDHWEGPKSKGRDAVPDADGWYEAEVPEGSIDLHVGARGLGYASILRRDVQIPADGNAARVEVQLVKGLGITLRLAVGQESPPENRIWLALLQSSELQAATQRVREGSSLSTYDVQVTLGMRLFPEREAQVSLGESYLLERLAPGHYHLVVLEPDVRIDPEEIEVLQDETTVEIRWQPK